MTYFDSNLYFTTADPLIGYPGLPGSATGQTCLWTGKNAMHSLGFHGAAIPGPTLINIIQEHSIIKKFTESGKKAGFLNAFSKQYLEKIYNKPRFLSASTHVQKASGQPFLSFDDLKNEKAIFTDITHEFLHSLYPEYKDTFPLQNPKEQGRRLMRAARDYDLSLFEYFRTDHAGHEQSFELASQFLSVLEDFIEGIMEELNIKSDLLIITSDHGNMEDLSVATHTRNPVPVIAYGHRSSEIAEYIKDITDIPRFISMISGIED
jgi:hypothetical protein